MNRAGLKLASLLAATAVVGSAHAAVIGVIDAGSNTVAGGTLEDLSTGGDNTGAMTGAFTAFTADYAADSSADVRWNNNEYDFAPGATGSTATWTFGGLTPGSVWNVYASWGNNGQANLSQAAPYTVQGTGISVNQEAGANSDLVLTDGVPAAVDFHSLGTAVVDGNGDIVVTLSGAADDWVIADAIAITEVPEPGSLALLGFGGLALLRRRRRA